MNWAVFKLKIVRGEDYVSNKGLTLYTLLYC